MSGDILAKLETATMIRKRIQFKDKEAGTKTVWGRVEDEVYIMVGDYKHMIQKFRFAEGVAWDGSEYGYRTGYYTLDKHQRQIKWGQFTQSLTEKEYRELLARAKAKGWPIFSN